MKKQLCLGAIAFIIAGLMITTAAGLPFAQMNTATENTHFETTSRDTSYEQQPSEESTTKGSSSSEPFRFRELEAKHISIAQPKMMETVSPQALKIQNAKPQTLTVKASEALKELKLTGDVQTQSVPTRGPTEDEKRRPGMGLEPLYDGENEKAFRAFYRRYESDTQKQNATTIFQGSLDRGESWSPGFSYLHGRREGESPKPWHNVSIMFDKPSVHFVGYNTTGANETMFIGGLQYPYSELYEQEHGFTRPPNAEGICIWAETIGDDPGDPNSTALYGVNWTSAYGGWNPPFSYYKFYRQTDAEAAAGHHPENISILGVQGYVMSHNIDTGGFEKVSEGPFLQKYRTTGYLELSWYSINYSTKVDVTIDPESRTPWNLTEGENGNATYPISNYTCYYASDYLDEDINLQGPVVRYFDWEVDCITDPNASDEGRTFLDRGYVYNVSYLNQIIHGRPNTYSYKNPSVAAYGQNWIIMWEVHDETSDEIRIEQWFNNYDGTLNSFYLRELLDEGAWENPEITHVQNETFLLHVVYNDSLLMGITHDAGLNWDGMYYVYQDPVNYTVLKTDKSIEVTDGGHKVYFETQNTSITFPDIDIDFERFNQTRTVEVNGFIKDRIGSPVPKPYADVMMWNLLPRGDNRTLKDKYPATIEYNYPVETPEGTDLLTFYERSLILGIDIYNTEDQNATLRIIGKHTDSDEVKVLDKTFDDLQIVNREVNLSLDRHYLDLKQYPWFITNTSSDNYDIFQLTGAATLQMQLAYLNWNSSIEPDGPPYESPYTWEEQDDWYEEAHANNSNTSLKFIDWQGMLTTLNNNLPGEYSEYGYNYAVKNSPVYDDIIDDICIWIDYEAPAKAGYPQHVPVCIPCNGNYSNWFSIRGVHTDQDSWRAFIRERPFDVYGFWINDPNPQYAIGIGENTYLTAQELNNNYFKPIENSDDTYFGEYLAIVEPPLDAPDHDGEARIIAAPAMWHKHPTDYGNSFMKSMSDSKIFLAALSAVEDLALYDEQFADVLYSSVPTKPIYVRNLADQKDSYYLCPLSENKQQSVNRRTHTEPQDTTMVVGLKADNGQFRGVTYSEDPVHYLPVTPDVAKDLVKQYVGEPDGNHRYIHAEYAYLGDGTSFFHPFVLVIYNGDAYTVSQQGNIEEL